MKIVLTGGCCPRCKSKMIEVEVTTYDYLGRNQENGTQSFLTTEGRHECPRCGLRIHVFIPQLTELRKEKA